MTLYPPRVLSPDARPFSWCPSSSTLGSTCRDAQCFPSLLFRRHSVFFPELLPLSPLAPSFSHPPPSPHTSIDHPPTSSEDSYMFLFLFCSRSQSFLSPPMTFIRHVGLPLPLPFFSHANLFASFLFAHFEPSRSSFFFIYYIIGSCIFCSPDPAPFLSPNCLSSPPYTFTQSFIPSFCHFPPPPHPLMISF